jgi:hypothetical protein
MGDKADGESRGVLLSYVGKQLTSHSALILSSVIGVLGLLQLHPNNGWPWPRIVLFSAAVAFMGSFIAWQLGRLAWYGQLASGEDLKHIKILGEYENDNDLLKSFGGATRWVSKYLELKHWSLLNNLFAGLKVGTAVFMIVVAFHVFIVSFVAIMFL